MPEEERPEVRFRVVRDLIIPLGSILGTATVLIQVWKTLPVGFLAVAAAFYALTILTTVWSLWPFLIRIVGNARRARRHRAIVRTSFPDFLRLVERFEHYMDHNRSDKLPHMLMNLNVADLPGKLTAQMGDYRLLRGFLESFKRRLAQFRGSVLQFANLANEFEDLVEAFHELYVIEPFTRLKPLISSESVSPARRAQIVQDFQIRREDYVRFMADYKECTELISSQLGERVLSSYLRPIGTLSVG